MVKKYYNALANLKLQPALGNGNCLFNGYSICVADANKLAFIKAHFEKRNEDIRVYNRIVELIRQAGSNLDTLQRTLAPFLRNLAIEVIKKQPGRYFKASLFNVESVFTTNLNDDIYCSHDFISRKFAELKKLAKDQQVRALTRWWKEEGFDRFLEAMRESGRDSGDLEGVALSDYLGLVFLVKAERYGKDFVCLNAANGEFPPRGTLSDGTAYRFSAAQIRELTHRAVAQRADMLADLQWEPLTREDVEERLSAVPSYQEVRDYIVNNKPAKKAPIPAAWKKNPALLEQLKLRGVVTDERIDKVMTSVFAKDNSIAEKLAFTLGRIAEVENKAGILSVWDDTFVDAEFVALRSQEYMYSGGGRMGHWDALVSKAPALIAHAEKAVAAKDKTVEAPKAKLEKKEKGKEETKGKEKGKEKEKEIEIEKEKVATKEIVAPKKPFNQAAITEMLQKIENGELKPSPIKWTMWVDRAQQESVAPDTIPEEERVIYAFGNQVKTIHKDTAEALDFEFAKREQQKEYEEYLKSCNNSPRPNK